MVLGRKMIISSGFVLPGPTFMDSVKAFDLDTETWTSLPSLTATARGGWRLAKIDIKVLRPK